MPRGGSFRICIRLCHGEALLIKEKETVVVDIDELLEKYRTLLAENLSLRGENEMLKARLGISLEVALKEEERKAKEHASRSKGGRRIRQSLRR